MSVPKIVWEKDQKNSQEKDKKIVETLIKRLNEQFKNDPGIAKKAAHIIEEWLKKKTKP